MRVSGKHHTPAALPPGKDATPALQGIGWAPEAVCMGVEILAPTEIRFHRLLARSFAIPTDLSQPSSRVSRLIFEIMGLRK
jgi:hypothetical protein